MFLKRKIEKSTENYWDSIKRLKSEIENADAIVIGAGAGLSTSAGFTYSGERFNKYFSDFAEKYGFEDMYSGGFYPFESLEEYWAYWSRYIFINRYMDPPKPVYKMLHELVKDKNYFVITTNVDHCFQKAGFAKERLFYTQGDYGLFQCSEPCHNKVYDNEEVILKMINQQKDMKVSVELVPKCPICNKPMSMNLRADDTFVEDDGWYKAQERYSNFLNKYKDKKVLFLELGTGMNTPGIIKFSFWSMTHEWKNATYACININEAYAPNEIKDKAICINDDILSVLNFI